MKSNGYTDNRSKKTVLALGCFDGVHIGHSALLKKARSLADCKQIEMAVLCFSEPPKNFFSPGSVAVITPKEQKIDLIKKAGSDITVCIDFNESIADMPPEEFFSKVIVAKMNAEHVVCGFNYRFGKNGAGNTNTLAALCQKEGISLDVIAPVKIAKKVVSSSEIRCALSRGDVSLAAQMLGRNYSISSEVVNGQHLGRELGFPTINQILDTNTDKLMRRGVYATRVLIDGTLYKAVTNVGIRPTVGAELPCAETHVFDFCKDLYGEKICVEFISFIRSEEKFNSLQELTERIALDVEYAKNAF